MKYIEKLRDFEDIEGLISEIKSDKSSQDILSRRFPIRLIFLQKFETFRVLIEKLDKLHIDIVHIEDYLHKPDGWITKDSLFDIISNLNNDSAIVPFSEVVRFYSKDDFKNFFNRLLLIENISNLLRRIYLPLIGIEQRFEKEFYQNFSRRSESAPVWGILNEKPNSIKVLLYANQLSCKINSYESINNTEEWLEFWKTKSPCDVICRAKPLNMYYNNTLPDLIFKPIKQLKNPKELIEEIINKEIPIPYKEDDFNFWDKLIGLINTNYDNYINFVKRHFNVPKLTIYNFLDIWLRTDDLFEKWLLKHFILFQECLKQKYLHKVLESIKDDYSEYNLLKNLYLLIFDLEIKEELINDRFKLIKQFAEYKPISLSDEFIQKIDKKIRGFTDYNHALLLITGLSEFEKNIIFEFYTNKNISNSESLINHYPDLYYYLSSTTFENINENQEWVYDYIKEYKDSKVIDKISDNLNILLSKLNSDQNSFFNWYHSFESIHSILHSHKVDKVFWIDALGIEWVSFIENYLNQKVSETKVIKNIIGVANLPTDTNNNRFNNAKHVREYDNLVHNNLYNYPYTIVKEFDEIKKIIDLNITLDSNQTVAIVSDHGLTALSRIVESKKYGKNDSHEGRYIEVNDKDHSMDTDYIIHNSDIDKKHYLIALKHNSLGKKPIREVHGGCTPEEVLVPLIIISNKKKVSDIVYSINMEKTVISKKEPVISIDITPKPKSANIEIGRKILKLKYNNQNRKWETLIDKSILNKREIEIKVAIVKIEKSFTLKIISGIIEEDLF